MSVYTAREAHERSRLLRNNQPPAARGAGKKKTKKLEIRGTRLSRTNQPRRIGRTTKRGSHCACLPSRKLFFKNGVHSTHCVRLAWLQPHCRRAVHGWRAPMLGCGDRNRHTPSSVRALTRWAGMPGTRLPHPGVWSHRRRGIAARPPAGVDLVVIWHFFLKAAHDLAASALMQLRIPPAQCRIWWQCCLPTAGLRCCATTTCGEQ